MSGLNDLNENEPTGLASPTQGDDELRAIKVKIKEYANVEHYGDGHHKFPKVSILPANDINSRRIVIKTTTGNAEELWYDDGTTWLKITSNQLVLDYINNLQSHISSNPITHADGSITTAKLNNGCVVESKLGNGAVLGRHLNAADSINADYSVAPLVNGSELGTNWHTHPQAGMGINFLSSVMLVASGSGDIAWTTINANTLSGGIIPVTAKAVMLSINISLVNSGLGGSATGVIIYGRKAIGNPSIIMNQYKVPTAVNIDSLLSVQTICPMTGTDGKFDFSTTVTDAFIGTWDISVFGYYT